ncbi:casein kinase I gamma-like [Panulirus ornatus]|uniref:casein kinase I gamma-like n=1 Tax=Panulirus ornatus TaxID=150431 RepID=UPI003A836BC0
MWEMQVVSGLEVDKIISHGQVLGCGCVGTAHLVRWHNNEAVIKLGHDGLLTRHDLEMEAYFMQKLNGAGGAPRLLGVSYDPLCLVLSFEGHHTLQKLLKDHHLSDRYLGLIGLQICLRLQEVHALGIIHYDLYPGNILVTLPHHLSLPPKINIIDFGMASYTASTIAHLPSEDRYLALTNGGVNACPYTVKDDLKGLADMFLEHIFPSMQEEAPLSARKVSVAASEGLVDNMDELVAGLREAFL